MRQEDVETGTTVRYAEVRHAIDLPVNVVIAEGEPLAARLINLSRHGFRLALPIVLPAKQPLRIEAPGWPRLAGRVVWSQGGRSGCLFEQPPEPKVFALMMRAVTGPDRAAF